MAGKVFGADMHKELPFRRDLGEGIDTEIDYVREKDKREVRALVMATAERGDGLSRDQFRTEADVDELFSLGVNYSCRDVAEDGRLYAYFNVYGSPLCRSNNPVMNTGYVIVDASYQAKGVLRDLMALWGVTSVAEGYEGSMGRTSLVASGAILNLRREGGVFTGILPDSINIDKKKWVDDVLYFTINSSYSAYKLMQKMGLSFKTREIITTIPDLKPMGERATRQYAEATTFREQIRSLAEKTFTGEKVRMELAGLQSSDVEDLIRQAAERGEGFALDEFDQEGRLNRKFLRHSLTLVARRRSDGELVGGAVLGPSKLVRAIKPKSLAGYLVVAEPFRRQGYGNDIVKICEGIARQLGYRNVMTDLLVSSSNMPAALQLAVKHGYMVTGNLSRCAFVKDAGLSDSFVLFKNFRTSRI